MWWLIHCYFLWSRIILTKTVNPVWRPCNRMTGGFNGLRKSHFWTHKILLLCYKIKFWKSVSTKVWHLMKKWYASECATCRDFLKLNFSNCIKLFIEREQNVQKTLNYGIVEPIRKCNFHGITFKYFHLIMSEINLIVMISYPSRNWIFKIPKMQFGKYMGNNGLQK